MKTALAPSETIEAVFSFASFPMTDASPRSPELDRFQEMQVFAAVAEEQSFNRAARRLALSAPSVTRAVAGLEQRLSTKLLNRTTRGVRITEAGERFLADCRRILAELEEAEGAAASGQVQTHGNLSVTTPVLFGELFVVPIMLDFLACEPAVTIRAIFADRIVSIAEEGIDVAIRIGSLPDSGLSAKLVGHVRRVICGAPAYLAEHGRPSHPQDLVAAHVVASSASTLLTEWRFREGDEEIAVHPTPRLVLSSNQAAIEAARRGFGITRVLSYQVAARIDAGELELLLPEYELPPIPVHVVYAGGRKAPAKVRAFVDYCVAALRRNPALR